MPDYRPLVQERIEPPEGETTPAGGAYMIRVYSARGGGYAPKEEAELMVQTEFDSADRMIIESWHDLALDLELESKKGPARR